MDVDNDENTNENGTNKTETQPNVEIEDEEPAQVSQESFDTISSDEDKVCSLYKKIKYFSFRRTVPNAVSLETS